jgi:hypothetical protein
MSLTRVAIACGIIAASCTMSHDEPGPTVSAVDFCKDTRPTLCRLGGRCGVDGAEWYCETFADWPVRCIPEPTERDVQPCVEAVQALTEARELCDLEPCRALCGGMYCD